MKAPKTPLSTARSWMLKCLVGVAALAATAAVHAYPGKGPIRIIVGTPAGGAVDIYARAVADGLAKELDHTVVVENRSGANGNIAAGFVVQQPADGHTIWVGTQAMVEINPSAFSQMPWKPDDFTPIIRGIEAPMVLVAHPSVPADDFNGLIEWLKKNPGTGYASFSPGTPSHFLGYQLSDHFDLDMVHIPYRGSGPQTADLLGGHTLVGFSQIQTTLPMIQDGRLKALATTGPERSRFLPDVPTLAELGLPDMTATIWFGMMVRSDTPEEIQAKLVEAMERAHTNPVIRERLETAGYDVSAETGSSFAESIAAGRERWARLVEATNFKAEN